MAVHIRLMRVGRKRQPYYRVVAADSRAPRDGRIIENLGNFDPAKEKGGLVINREKFVKWLKQGAETTDTIKSLLKKQGLWSSLSTEILAPKKPKKKKESANSVETKPAEQTAQ